MAGPVFYQELLLGSRRSRNALFRQLFCGWLVLLFLLLYLIYLFESNAIPRLVNANLKINTQAAGHFASMLLEWLVLQQIFVVLVATPALTAGAVTDEKSRGTLQYLLAADLTSSEIILGKLLGRLYQVVQIAGSGLPLLCFVGVFGGLDPFLLLAALLVTFLPALALGPVSLLAAVWSRSTRDAVIGVYALLIAGYIVLRNVGGLDYFNPMFALEPLWRDGSGLDVMARLPMLVLCWGIIGVGSLGLAVWRLRPAYLRQLQGAGRPKRVRWWLARRAAVSDEPIRWKERHVEGVAPLAILRRFPRWLGMLLIFAVTAISSVLLLWLNLPGNITLDQLLRWAKDVDVLQIWTAFSAAAGGFFLQAVIALLLATLMIGIRCSGAVTGERERQTWEALLLTPLPVRHMVRGKLWGIIGATYPYLLAYVLPALAFSLLAGIPVTAGVGIHLLATWLAMCFVGAAGIWCSVRSKSSWRSLLGTLGISYVGGFFLFVMSLPLIMIVYLVILLTLLLVDTVTGGAAARGFASGAWTFVLGSYIVLLAIFGALTLYFINDAEKYVADRERIRHWQDEPMNRGLRPRSATPIATSRSVGQDVVTS